MSLEEKPNNAVSMISHAIEDKIYCYPGTDILKNKVHAKTEETRTVNIGKGSLFCQSEFIPGFAKDVFRNFASDCMAKKKDKTEFLKALAEH